MCFAMPLGSNMPVTKSDRFGALCVVKQVLGSDMILTVLAGLNVCRSALKLLNPAVVCCASERFNVCYRRVGAARAD